VYTDALLHPWFESALALAPGVSLFDAHTHTGANDPDGYRCDAERLIKGLEFAGARGVVFPMQEPDGYRPANDRVIAEAEESDGRLVAFCRLDPADDPLAETERALGRGARGIKLHPRAERFRLADERLEGVFALAGERRLPVICHAGRGIPALGRDALELTERHPGMRLVLAHDGVCDLGWIWRHAADHPNLFFDTAWWSALDHLTLFGLVPPGQILFASDMPYGSTAQGAIMALRAGAEAGLSPDQLRVVAGGQIERLLAGDDPIDLGPAPGAPGLHPDILVQRIHGYLVAVVARMFVGEAAEDYVGLARLACEVGEDSPYAPVAASVVALLDRIKDRGEARDGRVHPAVALAVIAANVAITPDVPVPDLAEDPEVAEREG
jgi:predicted TIM-barrel fold metal-dependent hydrolase